MITILIIVAVATCFLVAAVVFLAAGQRAGTIVAAQQQLGVSR